MPSEQDTERVAVQTYVPAYQRDEWRADADEMGMSLAEFVRTMVQAGRRDFDLGGNEAGSGDAGDRAVDPRGSGLEDRVLELLRTEEALGWDELVAGLTDDIEDRLDQTLADLQQQNVIRYSGRQDAYTVVDDGR